MPADVTPRMTPAQVAGRVAEVIRVRPREHDQWTWFDIDEDDGRDVPVEDIITGGCGTTCCVAGWAAVLAAPPGSRMTLDSPEGGAYVLHRPDGSIRSILYAGAEALGLDGADDGMPSLFYGGRTRDEVLAELDRIAGGGDPR